MSTPADREKQLAAEAAAELVEAGMTVGLGTGTTVAHLFPALAARRLAIRCVATSPHTEQAASAAGLRVEPFTMERLDLTIDGADQIDPAGWLVKGGGGAHTREKVVALAAERFVVIADASKPVAALRSPVPLELLAFGLPSTLAHVRGEVRLRQAPPTPDGGVLADYTGEVGDPAALAAHLEAIVGVVDHGLFPPDMVSVVLVGRGSEVERLDIGV
ncbi:MAG TPA: ribose 5-phosphate isomerase A [Acidimicrobiales bacterium]|nr:ribose 5-phosphate isomerase A [Acidimicrobiales bacterium]